MSEAEEKASIDKEDVSETQKSEEEESKPAENLAAGEQQSTEESGNTQERFDTAVSYGIQKLTYLHLLSSVCQV